jgi:pyridinium-3,5-biscarboxylic acid mononucleotide synthase
MTRELRELLHAYRDGDMGVDEVIQRIVRQPYEEHILGKFDHHREERTGIPEVVFVEGKDPDHVRTLFETYADRDEMLIGTRVPQKLLKEFGSDPRFHVYPIARVVSTQKANAIAQRPKVLILSAGASDASVAHEARVVSRLLGNPTELVSDVGVAGLGRLAHHMESLESAGIVIVVAGMDGALPSVVGGMARQPVIAVPTSVGYGASFQGLAALLTMLNACSPGIAVMNIDNGFGAAVLATKINQLVKSKADGDVASPSS